MSAAFKSYRKEERDYIIKIAILGFHEVQKMILKAYNLFENKNARAFSSKEAALKYLLSE